MTTDAAALVERLTADLAPLERDVSEAWWQSNVASSPEVDARRIALEKQLSDRYADPAAYEALRAAAAAGDPDPLVARSVQVLLLAHAAAQLPEDLRAEMVQLNAACDTAYATFRGESAGRRWNDNEIEEVLGASNDSAERQAAWEASKQVGTQVEASVLRLVELRNDAARRLGHDNYYRMSLALGEISEDRLFALLDELDILTAQPFAELKREMDARLSVRVGVPVDELLPWHYADPFFQNAPPESAVDLDPLLGELDAVERTLATYDGLGIELRPVVERSDLFGREGKNQHAFCVNVDRGADVRVLCNIIGNERWMSTTLHEFGHAAYDVAISAELPWALRRPAHSLTTEAVAQLFGRLSRDPGWLRDVAGVPDDKLGGLHEQVDGALRASMLIFARWVLVMCTFERELYRTPSLDANAFWWQCVERFQGLRTPPGRDTRPDWAAKLHLALAPVYYQNYVLGECLASQLAATVAARGGKIWSDEPTGRWLVDEVFAPGSALRWDRLIERATGHPLSAAAFAAQFID
ncbi:MAG: peptidyl-dipeptidase [Frankiaceae bacterium]|nr:peptidyl-dipeptidase [Frankiaceae bacterium]